MFTFEMTSLPGVKVIQPKKISDHRGCFTKTFHQEIFSRHRVDLVWAEEYFSFSKAGVLRGMHFQRPPHDHAKMVYCVSGEVIDVVVDLRHGSPTFGRHFATTLSSENGSMLYIPPGLAHGFFALSDSIMMYKVTSVYAPESDQGIHWQSIGFNWPGVQPLLSERDNSFPPLTDFDSPFIFSEQTDVP